MDKSSPAGLPVLAVFGPTASGKSAVAEALAQRIPAEIVSADAMQVYVGLPILTNQPEPPTRLAGIWPLDHEASVGEYQELAHAAVDEILSGGRTPIVTGGTGLYFRAALAELDLPPAPQPGARERWESLYADAGPQRAHSVLAERDPAAARAVHPNDRRRVIRALELTETGSSLAPARERLWAEETRYPTRIFGLDVPRDMLAARIEARARAMFERGVEDEVRHALKSRLSSTARHVIGLAEIAELPREEAIAALARRTRAYAAYQRKWMRRIPGIVTVSAGRSPAEVATDILAFALAPDALQTRGTSGACG